MDRTSQVNKGEIKCEEAGVISKLPRRKRRGFWGVLTATGAEFKSITASLNSVALALKHCNYSGYSD